MVESVRNLEASKKAVKNKWNIIAKKMSLEGYTFQAEQCRLKMKGIKSRHERRKKKEDTSGESPASDDDLPDDVGDILDKMPDITPVSVIDTDLGTQGQKRKHGGNDDLDSSVMDCKDSGTYVFYSVLPTIKLWASTRARK